MSLMVAIAKTEGDVTDAQARFIQERAVSVLECPNGAEALAHGRWLCQDISEPGQVIQRVLPLLHRSCDDDQRHDIVALMSGVANVEGEASPIQTQAIQKLAHDLGVRAA